MSASPIVDFDGTSRNAQSAQDPSDGSLSPPPAPDVVSAPPSPEFLALIPHEYARRHLVLSEGCPGGGGVEHLVVADRTTPWAVFNTGVRLGRAVRARIAPAEVIATAIDAAYALVEARSSDDAVLVEGSDDLERDLADAVRAADGDLLHTQGKAPAVRLVDLILFEALTRAASDVHIQPLRTRALVRYRLDGVLHTVRELPLSMAAAVIGRIKVIGRLDLAEQRIPQDGRATVSIGRSNATHATDTGEKSFYVGGAGRMIDLRIATLPSTYGERIVMRLLDPARSPHLTTLSGLGMPHAIEHDYLRQIGRAHGIVLATGPTGSGKTTTLYATLAWISASHAGSFARGCELNILTIEDPAEYDLSATGLAISQTQVDTKRGLTFAGGLRHILRQDPDVIMVGEVRDAETARIAVQASLTGHLVLSTLHTNDAVSAIARLIDLGVEPFLVSSALSTVLAQRLVRKVHAPCRGGGCDDCLGTGFKGRTAVFELLVVDDALRRLIADRAPAMALRAAAPALVTLRRAGEELVRAGITTMEELERVIEASEEVET